jgi:hypothetical protein
MGTLSKEFSGRQSTRARDYANRASLTKKPPAHARGRSVPLPRAHFSSASWKDERILRAARIFRCLDRGCAAGKPIRRMLRIHAWRWRNRHYASDPARAIQFGRGTLERLYRRWKAAGGNPEALANRWRPPIKLRRSHALDFARVCINSDVRSLAEAFGRLARPRATVYAYRLALQPKLLRRIVRLFCARRLVDCRARKARAAVNRFATGGAA